MKRINFIILSLFLILLVAPSQVHASKATCSYSYSISGTNTFVFTYEYGKKLSYEITGNNPSKFSKVTHNLKNENFVDNNGDIVCPNVSISSKTIAKGKWSITIKSGGDKSGTLKIIRQDDKEKKPDDIQNICVYEKGTDIQFSLGWSSKLDVYLEGNRIKDYTHLIKEEFSADDFSNSNCPEVYHTIQAKAKNIIISKKPILTEEQPSDKPDDNYDVSTGDKIENSDNNNSNNSNNENNGEDLSKHFLGNLTCGGTEFQFHKSLPNFTSIVYDLLKIATPIIVIITGMLDLLKAVSAQKEDEIKKAQQKLLRRLLAGAVVFLIFVILEIVINIIAEKNEAINALDCVNCFLNGAEHCGNFDFNGDKVSYDINNDGKFDYNDYNQLWYFVSGYDATVDKNVADINSDNEVNKEDVRLLKGYLRKEINIYDVNRNGKIDEYDLIDLTTFIDGTDAITVDALNSDINNDLNIDNSDLNMLKEKINPDSPEIDESNITFSYEYNKDSASMPYGLFTPSSASNSNKSALIVWFHGRGERGINQTDFKNSGFLKELSNWKFDGFNAYVLCPQLNAGETWNNETSRQKVENLINKIKKEKNIDTDKIILVGHSMGSQAVPYLACKNNSYSALVVLSGYNASESNCLNFKNIPTKGYVGTEAAGEDGTSYNYMTKTFKDTYGPENLTIMNVWHGAVPAEAFKINHNNNNKSDLIEWMLAQ